MSRHHLFNPEGMTTSIGFSHGVVADKGSLVHIAGQTGHHPDETIDDGLVDQFEVACRSVARVIEEAGGDPTDLVTMTIYTTEVSQYRDQLEQLGRAYRAVFGKHYPPMALIGVAELFDPRALVELVGVAVVP